MEEKPEQPSWTPYAYIGTGIIGLLVIIFALLQRAGRFDRGSDSRGIRRRDHRGREAVARTPHRLAGACLWAFPRG